MCRYGLRQLKAESNASLYVTSICRLFFTSLLDTATEFLKAFPQHLGCFSSQSSSLSVTVQQSCCICVTFVAQVSTKFTCVCVFVCEQRLCCGQSMSCSTLSACFLVKCLSRSTTCQLSLSVSLKLHATAARSVCLSNLLCLSVYKQGASK